MPKNRILPTGLCLNLEEAALLSKVQFQIGNLSLGLQTYSASIGDEIRRFLGRYQSDAARAENDNSWEVFILPPRFLGDLGEKIQAGQKVHESYLYPGVSFSVFDLGEQLGFITHKNHQALADFQRRVAVCCAPENPARIRTLSVVNTLIVPLLNEILARQHQFLLHCASLEQNGRGVLIAASTGGGKTTAALALLEQGFGLLSDDITVLDATVSPPLFRGLARDVRICPESLALFPRLHFLASRPFDSGKVAVRMEEVFSCIPAQSARATLLLFPTPNLPSSSPDAVRISAGEAIEHLIPHSMFVAGKYRFETRFMALLDMLEHSRAYLLRQHLTLKRLPGLVENLLHESTT